MINYIISLFLCAVSTILTLSSGYVFGNYRCWWVRPVVDILGVASVIMLVVAISISVFTFIENMDNLKARTK